MADQFDYTGIIATAAALLEKFGKEDIWLRSTPVSSTDPAAGTVTPGTPVDVPINGVQIKHNEYYTPGATIEDGDLFWVLDTWPGLDDEIKVDTTVHNVVKVWPIKSGDDFIVAFAQTRGGVQAPDLTEEQIALDEFGNQITIVTTDSLDADGNTVTIS